MILHFIDRNEIDELFTQFKSVKVGKSEVTIVDSVRKDSHWIIVLEK